MPFNNKIFHRVVALDVTQYDWMLVIKRIFLSETPILVYGSQWSAYFLKSEFKSFLIDCQFISIFVDTTGQRTAGMGYTIRIYKKKLFCI